MRNTLYSVIISMRVKVLVFLPNRAPPRLKESPKSRCPVGSMSSIRQMTPPSRLALRTLSTRQVWFHSRYSRPLGSAEVFATHPFQGTWTWPQGCLRSRSTSQTQCSLSPDHRPSSSWVTVKEEWHTDREEVVLGAAIITLLPDCQMFQAVANRRVW